MATGVLALLGAVVFTAPGAGAAEVSWTSKCVNKLAPGLDIPPSQTQVDVTVSPVKDVYSVGDLVTVNWAWKSYSKVPAAGLDKIPKDSTKPVGNLNLTGAQTGTVTVEGPRQNPEAPVGTDFIISDMTGTFTLTSAGTVNLAPKNYRVFTYVFGTDAETDCDPQGAAPGTVATLNVQDGQSSEATLNAPTGSVYPGSQFNLTGGNFAPNAAPQVSLCDADGSNCGTQRLAGDALAIDGAGKLTGTVTLAPGVAEGGYVVRVVDGVREARAAITVAKYVPTEPRTAIADVTSGPLGTVVNLHGENWTGNRNLNVFGLDADGFELEGFVNVTSTPDGKFTAAFPVNSEWLKTIRVREGTDDSKSVDVPFNLAAAGSNQGVSVNLAPGALTMAQAGDGINFGSATLNGEAQTLKANLNQVSVLDARGGNLGWSLTGSMTDLVAANGTDKIPAGNMSWAPSCAAGAGSLSTVANGTAGALGQTPATLCSVTPDGKTSGGKFTADAEITLTTPQFAAAGAYTGTLTLTLI
ncbi:hypothetical protein ACPA54_23910 [Uniformispora flossi]|uniref:hypothetical protein n=1 Tax=Uniformispora flossi TaxID=3390723 RepID=UPI003C2E0EF4